MYVHNIKMVNLRKILLCLILALFVLLLSYYPYFLSTSNDIPVGNDSLSHVIFARLLSFDGWIKQVQYGTPNFPTIPLIFVRALYYIFNNSCVVFAITNIMFLVVGCLGLFLFLRSLGADNKLSFVLASLVYVSNLGLRTELYHGLFTYVFGYALIPWVLVAIKSATTFDRKSIPAYEVIKKSLFFAVILVLFSSSHPLAVLTLGPIAIIYGIIVAAITYHKHRELWRIVPLCLGVLFAIIAISPYALLFSSESVIHSHAESLVTWHAVPDFFHGMALVAPRILNTWSEELVIWGALFASLFCALLFTKKNKKLLTYLGLGILFLIFTTLGMGGNGLWPFNELTTWLFLNSPLNLIRPFRWCISAGFIMSLMIGLLTQSTISSSKYYLDRTKKIGIKLFGIWLTALTCICSLFLPIFFLSYAQPFKELAFSSNDLIGRDEGLVYTIPNTEWVVPRDRFDQYTTGIWSNTTVKPWPHNTVAYSAYLDDRQSTTGERLKTLFDRIAYNKETRFLSYLFYYMNIGYAVEDKRLLPAAKYTLDVDFIKNQDGMHVIHSDEDLTVIKNTLLDNTHRTRIFDDLAIVATNPKNYLLLAASNGIPWRTTFPLFLDKLDEVYISNFCELLEKSNYLIMDGPHSFHDMLYLYSISKILKGGGDHLCYRDPSLYASSSSPGEGFSPLNIGVDNELYTLNSSIAFTTKPYAALNIPIYVPQEGHYKILMRMLAKTIPASPKISINGVPTSIQRSSEMFETSGISPCWVTLTSELAKGANSISITATDAPLGVDVIAVVSEELYEKNALSLQKCIGSKWIYQVLLPSSPYILGGSLEKREYTGVDGTIRGGTLIPPVPQLDADILSVITAKEPRLLSVNSRIVENEPKKVGNLYATNVNIPSEADSIAVGIPYVENRVTCFKSGENVFLGPNNWLFLQFSQKSTRVEGSFKILKGTSRWTAMGLCFMHDVMNGYEVLLYPNQDRVVLQKRVNGKPVEYWGYGYDVEMDKTYKVTVELEPLQQQNYRIKVHVNGTLTHDIIAEGFDGEKIGVRVWGDDDTVGQLISISEDEFQFGANEMWDFMGNGIIGLVFVHVGNRPTTGENFFVFHQAYSPSWELKIGKRTYSPLPVLYGMGQLYLVENNGVAQISSERPIFTAKIYVILYYIAQILLICALILTLGKARFCSQLKKGTK